MIKLEKKKRKFIDGKTVKSNNPVLEKETLKNCIKLHNATFFLYKPL